MREGLCNWVSSPLSPFYSCREVGAILTGVVDEEHWNVRGLEGTTSLLLFLSAVRHPPPQALHPALELMEADRGW